MCCIIFFFKTIRNDIQFKRKASRKSKQNNKQLNNCYCYCKQVTLQKKSKIKLIFLPFFETKWIVYVLLLFLISFLLLYRTLQSNKFISPKTTLLVGRVFCFFSSFLCLKTNFSILKFFHSERTFTLKYFLFPLIRSRIHWWNSTWILFNHRITPFNVYSHR